MELSQLRLESFTSRGLNLLGSIFGVDGTRIILLRRAKHPVNVLLDSNTLGLDPEWAGPFDLALGCDVLKRHRAERKKFRSKRELARVAREEWAPQSQRELAAMFPRVMELTGRFKPGASLDGFVVSRRELAVKKLPKLRQGKSSSDGQGHPSGRGAGLERGAGGLVVGGFEFAAIPEVDLLSAEDDMTWLLDAIAAGAVPLATVPTLEDLPFLRIPFRYALGERCPTRELLEQQLAEPWNKQAIQDWMKCYSEKSIVREQRLTNGRRKRSGVRLDPNRLVEAALASGTGIEPRLFRTRRSNFEPIFDPSEHLVLISGDMQSLYRQLDSDGQLVEPEAVHRFVAVFVTAFERLGVDCVIEFFADRLVTLADGRVVCLHFVTQLKALDDEFDDAFWNRLVHLFNRPPQLPGTPTTFHPLSFQDMLRRFELASREKNHSYCATLWWARHGMNRDFEQFTNASFSMRQADWIDAQIRELRRRHDGTLDTLASFLPRKLRDHGRPGEFLAEIEFD